jgi:hypothetical protein
MATCSRLDGVENLSTGGNDSCDTCGVDSEGGGYFIAGDLPFSWSDCDSCGSTVAGQRYPAHGHIFWMDSAQLCHFDICEDCAMAIDA